MRKRFFFSVCLVFCLVAWSFSSGEEGEKKAKTTAPRKSVKPVAKPSPTPTPIVVGEDLLANGDFEKKNPKHNSPVNWQLCDGLTSFYEKHKTRGKIIRIDTLVPKEEARERWLVMIDKGVDAPPAKKKGKLRGGQYSSIGATDGVHYFSDKIPVKGGAYYRLSCDTKGKSADIFFTKIFVKGYANYVKKRKVRKEDGSVEEVSTTEIRQVYKWYLACRNDKNEWKSFEDWIRRPMPRNVEYVKICIYAYWPNQNYYFDNLKFFEGKAPPKPKKKDK